MNARQLHYLHSMDIDVWQRRELVQEHTTSLPVHINRSITKSPVEPIVEAAQREPVSDLVTKSAQRFDPNVLVTPSLETWNDVELAVSHCIRCTLHTSRTQTVFGVGDRNAKWMIIGEAPGMEEDRKGEPFVGRAGQLLNAMLLAIGLQREQVFIANILKCRPPNNRDPNPEEVNCCMPYLHRQIELVNPRIILCVGRIAAQNLLDTDSPIGKLRGNVHTFGPQRRPVVVTYHPAYLLRSPGEKRKAWTDLQLALQIFASTTQGIA